MTLLDWLRFACYISFRSKVFYRATFFQKQMRTRKKNNKRRILVIGPTPPPYNGMSVATELILSGLSDKFDLIHLDTADRRGLSNIGKLDLVNITLALTHGLRFLYLLFTKRPKVIYVPISQATLPFLRDCLFLIPARLLRRNVVIHLHGGYFREFYLSSSMLMRWVIRYALGQAARVIVLGESLTNLFDSIVPRDRIRVVPNGIADYLEDHKCVVAKGDPFKILFLSTLMKEKGFLHVLQAIPFVTDKVKNVQFIFVGEWFRNDCREEAMALVEKLNLEPYVEFKGPIGPPLKYQLFQEADVFVLPSYYDYEGHPFVILEAMCAGLPIITTNAGCIPETVIDGVNGFIVEKRNPQAIAEKILKLLEDDELRVRMGTASRERFLKHFTRERFIEGLTRVFHEVLGS